MYYYVQQSDIESYLDVTLTGNGQNTFNLLRGAMQDAVDLYCNRSWNFTNPTVENFDALTQAGGLLAQNVFWVSKPPISTAIVNNAFPLAQGIISVAIGNLGNVPVDMNYVFSYGSFVKLSSQFPTVALSNPLGFKMIQITYNSDAAQNVPTPVKQALIEWIARKLQISQDAGRDTTQVQTGTIRAYYKEDKDGSIPDFVKFVLDAYRLTPIDKF